MRNKCLSYECFKSKLDLFLLHIPDNPYVSGQPSRIQSNTIIDQIDLLKRDGAYNSILEVLS